MEFLRKLGTGKACLAPTHNDIAFRGRGGDAKGLQQLVGMRKGARVAHWSCAAADDYGMHGAKNTPPAIANDSDMC
jgi:hypothetical protein